MFFGTQTGIFSSNPGKGHFEGLVQLLRHIRDKNNSELKYYAKMYDAPLSDLFIQANIKTENQVIVFYYYSWQECPNIGISKGSYIFLSRCTN